MSKLVRVSDKTYALINQMKGKNQSIGGFIHDNLEALESFITYQYFMELKPYQQKIIRDKIFALKYDSKLNINCSKIEK